MRIAAVAGARYQVTATALDPATGRKRDSYWGASFPLDPELRITSPIIPNQPLAFDANSGPGLNAAIGDVPGSSAFVAPWTGEFDVSVRAWLGGSNGPYLLTIELLP